MVNIDLQNDESLGEIPGLEQIRIWVEASLQETYQNLEQTVRVVGITESQTLNRQYRAKDAPTNVLSFPTDSEYLDYQCLGDLVICAPIVEQEATQQQISGEAHWAHMVIHGMLHLQGMDHQSTPEAEEMELIEGKILSTLGYNNPYNV